MKSKEMGLGNLLFSTHGRIGRFDWWTGHLVAFIVVKLVIIITHYSIPSHLSIGEILNIKQVTIGMLLGILYIWVHISLCVKRWHDMNKPSWFVVFNYIPIIGTIISIIWCGFIKGTGEANKHGEAP